METFNIYKNLAWLNELPEEDAVGVFRNCSGSELFATRMTAARPFTMLGGLYEAADDIWFSLPRAEWIAAFSSLEVECSGTELAESTRLYNDKFGFIFVVGTIGKSSEELLAICRARLGNSFETELQIAAEEHWKILESRLNTIFEK